MKRLLGLLTPVIVVLVIAACEGETANEAEDDRTSQSYSTIDDAGAFENAAYEAEIRDEMYRSAYEDGYSEGLRDGEGNGYESGHQDGYDEGWFDGCVWLGETLVANGAQIWYQC